MNRFVEEIKKRDDIRRDNKTVFDDLVSDLNGDWFKIQEKIQEEQSKSKIEEEIKDKIKNPKRFNFPNFKDFYRALLDVVYKNDYTKFYSLHYLADRIVNNIEKERIPDSLITIWESLCNPMNYGIKKVRCRRCGNLYDIIHEYNREKYYMYNYDSNFSKTMEMKITRVYCTSCGEYLASLNGCKVISMFLIQDTFHS